MLVVKDPRVGMGGMGGDGWDGWGGVGREVPESKWGGALSAAYCSGAVNESATVD